MSPAEILHVSPVMPVDEHHIELALDRMKALGKLYTSWLPSPMEQALLRNFPLYYRGVRREPVRLHHRSVHRQFLPDLRRSLTLMANRVQSVVQAHDCFFEEIDRRAARDVSANTKAVICREFGALHTFRAAKNAGARCIYHLPTVHHRRLRRILVNEEANCRNVCSETFDKEEFSSRHLAHKDEELALADLVICPSAFVGDSLLEAGLPESKVRVLPFGAEAAWLDCKRPPSTRTILFVGNISARKGAHRLIRTWHELGGSRTHQLVMVGDMHLSHSFQDEYAGTFKHVPKVSRDRLRDLYLSADALVLPALAEGFALVLLEAASCGTAVLASSNSGADGFLKNGTEAVLFESQNDQALREALQFALESPEQLAEIGRGGRACAARWTWENFENGLMDLLRDWLS